MSTKQNSYRVIWEIDVEADSPEDAARQAREIQMDQIRPDATATVFDVRLNGCGPHGKGQTTIDLADNPLTPIARHISNGGVKCLLCGDWDIVGGPFDGDAGLVWQDIFCNACHGEYKEVYRLDRVETLEGEPFTMPEHSAYAARCMLAYLVGMLAQLERQGDLPAKVAGQVAYAFERHTEPRGTAIGKRTPEAAP